LAQTQTPSALPPPAPPSPEFRAQRWTIRETSSFKAPDGTSDKYFGPALGTFSKHLRAGYHSPSGRWYFFGGDHNGSLQPDGTKPYALQSGRNEVYTYDVGRNIATLEQPYCRPDGDIQPHGLDEVGLTWVSKVGKFFSLFGYQWPTSRVPCSGSRHGPMAYDPTTRKWEMLSIPMGGWGLSVMPNNAFYDETLDALIFVANCGGGPCVWRYSRAQQKYLTDQAALKVGNAPVWDTLPAHDVEGRAIYLIVPGQGQLVRYNIASNAVENLGPIPNLDGPVHIENSPVWDSVSKVLLYPHLNRSLIMQLHAYDPAQRKWTPQPMPNGVNVVGLHTHFDPVQNVMFHWGTGGKFFFYRYGEKL